MHHLSSTTTTLRWSRCLKLGLCCKWFGMCGLQGRQQRRPLSFKNSRVKPRHAVVFAWKLGISVCLVVAALSVIKNWKAALVLDHVAPVWISVQPVTRPWGMVEDREGETCALFFLLEWIYGEFLECGLGSAKQLNHKACAAGGNGALGNTFSRAAKHSIRDLLLKVFHTNSERKSRDLIRKTFYIFIYDFINREW